MKILTVELTSEQVVTNLLSSNEVLKRQKQKIYLTNPTIDTLGDFLMDTEPDYTPIPEPISEVGKYIFIKQ